MEGRAISAEGFASRRSQVASLFSEWVQGLQAPLEAMLANAESHTTEEVLDVLRNQGTEQFYH
jgi:hypothetical protein